MSQSTFSVLLGRFPVFLSFMWLFGPVLQVMLFVDISYLQLWWPFCSAERNHLVNFGRGLYEEHFCEIILNLDQWFRKKFCLKIFLIQRSSGPFVQRSGTICAVFVEGIMSNISMKLFGMWTSGSGGNFVCSTDQSHLCKFSRRRYEEHFWLFWIWISGSLDVKKILI